MKSLLVPIVLSTTVGIGGVVVAPIVTVIALNPQPVMPIKGRFAIDDWSTVAEYASQGIDVLHEKYKYECENNKAFPNTLIGLKKDMTINGITYPVMVIDENRDVISGTEKKAALTLQFRHLINNLETGETIYCKYGDSTDWETSSIRLFLQNDFQNQIELILDKMIPTVDKLCDTPETSNKIVSDTIFIPSYDEIGGDDSDAYAYYVGEPDRDPSAKRIIRPLHAYGSYAYYWTRTTVFTNVYICGCDDGNLTHSTKPGDEEGVGIAPIFNI